ncbi:hypothetical protein [Hoeflea sp.]|uniref:hypothetical protein n=1 Tax=Hoeflea sp. TaxID=1940281 RepID=UPI0025B96482|nr:hypothetical protein [Hoeflea sp.]
MMYISATASMTARTERRPRSSDCGETWLPIVPGGLGHLHGHAARGHVDPFRLVAIGIALAAGRALVEPGAEKALSLDLHRQLEGPGEHRGDLVRPVLDQLFQDRLNRVKAVP